MKVFDKNLVLIGFMGTGKSAVGKALARWLGRKFIELDREIARSERKTIPQIFAKMGEPYFRRVERRELRNAVAQRRIVLATGGGVILNPLNVRDLRRSGILICLTANLREIYKRTSRNPNRPLLQNKNPFQTIRNLLKYRRPLYRRAADFFVSTTGKTASQTAYTILKRLQKLK